jgi:peptide deformylase
MTVLSIVQLGDSNKHLLREICEEVSDVSNQEVRKLIIDMWETLNAEKTGVGLAAPQVGQTIRLILVKTKDFTETLANPVIVSRHAMEKVDEEGCLSVPGVWKKVKRSHSIVVSYTDRNGFKQETKLKGFSARVVQHEVEHLNGILITDKK